VRKILVILIKNYLKIENVFVPYEECSEIVSDSDYVEGAIELTINGVELVNKSMWDYVDQLWAYIIQGVNSLTKGEKFSTYFPDQPIELVFNPLNDYNVEVIVHCGGTKRVVISKRELIDALRVSGKNFLLHLSNIAPENKDTYAEMIKAVSR
jgi:hypothetical protein